MTKEELRNKINKKIDLARVEDRYSLFEFDCVKEKFFSDFTNSDVMESLYDLLEEWDNNSRIPYNTGILLNELIEDKNIVPAIHRTKFQYTNIGEYKHNDDLENIMYNGLYNNGHANAQGGGVILKGTPDVLLTMTPLRGISGIINLVGTLHGSNTTVIAAFPKELVTEDLENKRGMETSIYDYHDSFYYIKPEYIVGALIKDNDKSKLDAFYLKNEILENRYLIDNDKNSHI